MKNTMPFRAWVREAALLSGQNSRDIRNDWHYRQLWECGCSPSEAIEFVPHWTEAESHVETQFKDLESLEWDVYSEMIVDRLQKTGAPIPEGFLEE